MTGTYYYHGAWSQQAPPADVILAPLRAGHPRLMLDEARLAEIRRDGLTIMLVEQNARAALAIGDRAYVLVEGQQAHEGPARTLWDDPVIAELYLGQRRES